MTEYFVVHQEYDDIVVRRFYTEELADYYIDKIGLGREDYVLIKGECLRDKGNQAV